MDNVQDQDMYLFRSSEDLGSATYPTEDFTNFLTSSLHAQQEQDPAPAAYLDPRNLSIENKKAGKTSNRGVKFENSPPSTASSSSSSSHSPTRHARNASGASNAGWNSGINGLSMPSADFADTSMSGYDPDYETSNQQMASDFDFETAASTPSGFDAATMVGNKMVQPFRKTTAFADFGSAQNPNMHVPGGQATFFFPGSRETSPLNPGLVSNQGRAPWSKHSPSSGLEETFNHINMNGDSPGGATFSPNLRYLNSGAGFTFEPDSSNTPPSFANDFSTPPSTITSSESRPTLSVHPTSLKSRVETQIPIKLTLSFLPNGVSKLRLPRYTVSKPKFLSKPEVDRSPDILELHTSLVCTSAMQDHRLRDRALARARGEDVSGYTRPSPASSNESRSSAEDEDKPLNGGEVKICSGCIQRERKRASRKKSKRPEEEEMFQRDEERRVVVFNTNEIKDWVEIPRDPTTGQVSVPDGQPMPGPRAMQVELPMRIACYCRHQNEKLGFQVIFTVKDYQERPIAQTITNSIMITDDHKTHNAPPLPQAPPPLPSAPQFPGAGVFAAATSDSAQGPGPSRMYKQSFSTTDLQGLQHNFNPTYPMAPSNNPFAVPTNVQTEHPTMTPRNLSRPASPSGPSGPTTKRRKQSGSGKLPSGLTMTRLDTSHHQQPPSTAPNTAVTSTFPTNAHPFMANDHPYAMPQPRPPYELSPPTPITSEHNNMHNVNRSFSMENLTRQGMISAPSSRQPSRPGSPASGRNSFGTADQPFGQAVMGQMSNPQITRRPPPLIHKIVPAEGSVTGGQEVTILGSGFYRDLEVMFGDSEALTTSYWGEKCLNCIAPPALCAGTVSVTFKHEHPQHATVQPQTQSRTTIFTYVDDRELEIFKLALRTLGKQLPHPTDDPLTTARALLQQNKPQNMWGAPSNGYNIGSAPQRYANGSPHIDMLELETTLMGVLEYLDRLPPTSVLNLNLTRPSGLTLLHLASSLGLTRFVQGLLSRGANPNALDNCGHAPMHHAAMNAYTHVIHRLRLAGANHKVRSVRNFMPADLATSLQAYQATVTPTHHYRSRSVGGTPMRLHSRNASSSSLRSFWESGSTTYSYGTSTDVEDDSDDESLDSDRSVQQLMHLQQDAQILSRSLPASRRSSAQHTIDPTPTQTHVADNTATPTAYVMAWQEHIVSQIRQLQQYQENYPWLTSHLPSLPAVPALPTMPDYQTYPVMRRVSSLFPPRTPQTQASPGWWDSLVGSSVRSPSAPPAYDELYPDANDADMSLKKASGLQAAVDTMADAHFSQSEEDSKKTSSASGTKTSEQPDSPVSVHAEIKRIGLRQDRKLFFFWIPLLAIVLALMIRSSNLHIFSDMPANKGETITNRLQQVVGV